ncbi:MAG: hypothetical protein M3521_07095, partial [Acidobacteriota bacterium]|nr:hypothetical protein [Acidobacteriota bacterium]
IDFYLNELIPVFLLANLMSPALWAWRDEKKAGSDDGILYSPKNRLRSNMIRRSFRRRLSRLPNSIPIQSMSLLFMRFVGSMCRTRKFMFAPLYAISMSSSWRKELRNCQTRSRLSPVLGDEILFLEAEIELRCPTKLHISKRAVIRTKPCCFTHCFDTYPLVI